MIETINITCGAAIVSLWGNEKQGNIHSGPTLCIAPAQRENKDKSQTCNKPKIVKKCLEDSGQVMRSLPSGGLWKFKLHMEEQGGSVMPLVLPLFALHNYNLICV